MSRERRDHWTLPLWLALMGLFAEWPGFGSRAYLWAVGKASDATDWGDTDDGAGGGA